MKEIFIERNGTLLRIAIKCNKELCESIVEEKKNGPLIGMIYKGKVKNIIQGTNSAFIDLGNDTEAYMYYNASKSNFKLKKGDDILVEVIKEPIGSKNAKVSDRVCIPGRYVVLNCYQSGIEFSRRISDLNIIHNIKDNISVPADCGVTIRTEGANVSLYELQSEIDKLSNIFANIKNEMTYSTNLKVLYGENSTLRKVIDNSIGYDNVSIVVNNKDDYEFILKEVSENSNFKVNLYNEYRGLFDYYEIEKELLKLRHHKVNLLCGGSIVIDKTEAMYVIDVNSGKNVKERNFDKTILDTNLEAASEIGKQIRLRNLSGIIVIDFIDMRDKTARPKVMAALKESLKDDKGNVKIFPFTELDLVQIARKRQGKSIYEYMEEECMQCKGRGMIMKLSYITGLIKNEITKFKYENSINAFHVSIDSVYENRIKENIYEFISNIDSLGNEIYLTYCDNIEGYRVEPLLFQNQRDNLKDYKVNNIEKY